MARFLSLEELFERRHFDSEIIILFVRVRHSAPEHGAVSVKIYLRHATNPQQWTIREEPAIRARTSRHNLACGGSRRGSEP